MKKNISLWIITLIFTLATAYFQRISGPTKPVRGSIEIDSTLVKFKLLRSELSGVDAEVRVFVGNDSISGGVEYKRYNSNDDWMYQQMYYKDGFLTAILPTQPAAGKVIYKVVLRTRYQEFFLTEEPVIIRYKNQVPNIYLIPHILFMFLAMLYSNRAGLQVFFNKEKLFRLSLITFSTLILGGLVFGPIVQKYAFGDYWTGFPFGHDLTDNKTALAVIFWGIALYKTWRKTSKAHWWVLTAALVLLLTYMIPHSLFGSELDYTAENM
ncbi:MAG: hypothetical protein PHT69_11460 [Bacteroidales bacterium]|nr:hypothetical protein [Bacteroidales bacterium]